MPCAEKPKAPSGEDRRELLGMGCSGLDADDFGIILESVFSNVCDAFWDFDGFERVAAPKCIISNACDTIWNMN